MWTKDPKKTRQDPIRIRNTGLNHTYQTFYLKNSEYLMLINLHLMYCIVKFPFLLRPFPALIVKPI